VALRPPLTTFIYSSCSDYRIRFLRPQGLVVQPARFPCLALVNLCLHSQALQVNHPRFYINKLLIDVSDTSASKRCRSRHIEFLGYVWVWFLVASQIQPNTGEVQYNLKAFTG